LNHAPGSLVQRFKRGKVALQSCFEVLRFTNIENSSLAVIEAIDAWSCRDLGSFRSKR
jgi:hypothetical protein